VAIPDFQSIMLPFMRQIADGKEHCFKDILPILAEEFGMTRAELAELLSSGKQPRFLNRIYWAKAYLSMAGLLESTRRSYFRATARGLEALKHNPTRIDIPFLRQFPEFAARREGRLKADSSGNESGDAALIEKSPEEVIETAFTTVNEKTALDLLDQIKKCSPGFFERLVVDLLVKIGYGGSIQDAGEAIGKSGDGGIDGIIKEDRLGLDVIYIQAKRWENTVGRPQIQNFVGALHGKGTKGVFITTSSFTKEATEYARSLGNLKVILIDGDKLADLMIDHGVGVSIKEIYQFKKVDYDYFSEEE
jgi:restriction system protein